MSDHPEKLAIETTPPNVSTLHALEAILPGVVADGVVDAQRIADLAGLPLAGIKREKSALG